jgi:hypothetical protein
MISGYLLLAGDIIYAFNKKRKSLTVTKVNSLGKKEVNFSLDGLTEIGYQENWYIHPKHNNIQPRNISLRFICSSNFIQIDGGINSTDLEGIRDFIKTVSNFYGLEYEQDKTSKKSIIIFDPKKDIIYVFERDFQDYNNKNIKLFFFYRILLILILIIQ